MEKMFSKVDGSLQELANSHRMTVRELGGVKKSVEGLEKSVEGLEKSVESVKKSVESVKKSVESLQASAKQSLDATVELRGTFASIEGMFRDHETRITALEKKQAS